MQQKTENNDIVFQKINTILMQEEEPSKKMKEYAKTDEFNQSVFEYLNRLKKVEQSPVHHPEGNVWIHTMMVVDEAAKVRNQSKNPSCFMWAALLHDIGKPDTLRIRKGKITTYDHDKVGREVARNILEQTSQPEEFIHDVCNLVRWHMQILFVIKDMSFVDIASMRKEVDLDEIALLGRCDRMGRGNVERDQVERDIQLFKEKIKQ